MDPGRFRARMEEAKGEQIGNSSGYAVAYFPSGRGTRRPAPAASGY